MNKVLKFAKDKLFVVMTVGALGSMAMYAYATGTGLNRAQGLATHPSSVEFTDIGGASHSQCGNENQGTCGKKGRLEETLVDGSNNDLLAGLGKTKMMISTSHASIPYFQDDRTGTMQDKTTSGLSGGLIGAVPMTGTGTGTDTSVVYGYICNDTGCTSTTNTSPSSGRKKDKTGGGYNESWNPDDGNWSATTGSATIGMSSGGPDGRVHAARAAADVCWGVHGANEVDFSPATGAVVCGTAGLSISELGNMENPTLRKVAERRCQNWAKGVTSIYAGQCGISNCTYREAVRRCMVACGAKAPSSTGVPWEVELEFEGSGVYNSEPVGCVN